MSRVSADPKLTLTTCQLRRQTVMHTGPTCLFLSCVCVRCPCLGYGFEMWYANCSYWMISMGCIQSVW
jgi:hypothetical protein